MRNDPLDDLYEAPLAEFTTKRNAIVARLRKEGHAEKAKALAGVAKPKATIWAINRVARASPKLVKRVVAAFDALKTAQLRAPEKMAAAGADFREATEAVVHEAIAAMKDAGLTTSLDTHRRITNTLRGAAASARDALLEGRLSDEVAPGGFELLGGEMPRGRRAPLRVVARKAPAPPAPARDDLARRRAAQLEEEAREREEAARSASAALQEARERLRELEAQARAATRTATKSRGLAARAQKRARARR